MKNDMKRYGIVAVLLVFGLAVAGLLGALPGAKPTKAESVVGYNNIVLVSAVNVTSTVTGTLADTRYYGIGDCYSIYDASTTTPQTVTVKTQHSADGAAGTWVDSWTASQQTGAGVQFSRTTMYGQFTRAIVQVSGINPLTLTVRCAVKNTQQ